jgi:hypothetical protein
MTLSKVDSMTTCSRGVLEGSMDDDRIVAGNDRVYGGPGGDELILAISCWTVSASTGRPCVTTFFSGAGEDRLFDDTIDDIERTSTGKIGCLEKCGGGTRAMLEPGKSQRVEGRVTRICTSVPRALTARNRAQLPVEAALCNRRRCIVLIQGRENLLRAVASEGAGSISVV